MKTHEDRAEVRVHRSHRRRRLVWSLLVVAVVAAGMGGYLFEPWKLWVDEVVDEGLPTVVGSTGAGSDGTSGRPARRLELLAAGGLVSHEHTTTGTVRVLRLPDRSRILRLEDFRTSNGPDLHVWITDAAVVAGRDGWFVFDDGQYVDLGALKGNIGSQNYVLPSAVDLVDLHSVSIWCDRFNVSFGAAALAPPS